MGEREGTANEYKISLWSDRNILALVVMGI